MLSLLHVINSVGDTFGHARQMFPSTVTNFKMRTEMIRVIDNCIAFIFGLEQRNALLQMV